MIRYGNPRRDNRMFFARQGSAVQGRFMRQVSIAQVARDDKCEVQNSQASFHPQQSGGEPMFARACTPVANPLLTKLPQPTAQVNVETSFEPPNFARPGSEKTLISFNQNFEPPITHEPSPRMDIAETTKYHIVTLELPGANIVDIKVEVDDNNLTVTGKRSYPRWKTEAPKADAGLTFRRREILQGPYTVIWPLPKNVNRDLVSAELLNGFLRIILPKILVRNSYD
ncbi:uncharacterized protein LOC144700665 isoform X2 [Wolffia australiana]